MKRAAIAVLWALCALAGAQPAPNAAALLRHMLESAPRLRYTGTRTLTVRQGVDTRVHEELIEKDGERTRTEFPKGSPAFGQVIVEAGGVRRHFNGRNEIRTAPSGREKALVRLEKIINNRPFARRLQLADGGSVAGQRAMLVTLTFPNGSPMQRLWIEPRSGMLLKREIYDRTGALQAGFEFTKVNLNPRIDPRDFALNIPGAHVISPRDELRQVARRLGLPEVSLPIQAPFQLDAVKAERIAGQEVLVQQYSDDDQEFTFFMLRGAIDAEQLRRRAAGLQSVAWQKDGVNYALVGEVPQPILEQVASQLGRS